MPQNRVLTFESWVTKPEWFRYAKSHPYDIPYLLADRSQCQDPFFDLFAPFPTARQPMITGVCRRLKSFKEGDRYVYVTKLCPEAARQRGCDTKKGGWYLGVASMIVVGRANSHEEAGRAFSPRRYVAAPMETPYPPGLAHSAEPIASVARESCVVHVASCGSKTKTVALTPDRSTVQQWRTQYSSYHRRAVEDGLGAAFCRFEALATYFKDAPLFSNADWGNRRMNVMGLLIDDVVGRRLAAQIPRARPLGPLEP